MSGRELKRVAVLGRVKAGSLSLASAAVLMAVSYRQAKRLYRRYRVGGAKALKHRSAGRRSNRATPARRRGRVLALIRQKYGGSVAERFGPTLAAENLATEDGTRDPSRDRCGGGWWPRACGSASANGRGTGVGASGWPISGSCCNWTGARMPGSKRGGPTACLLTLVDDATRGIAGLVLCA